MPQNSQQTNFFHSAWLTIQLVFFGLSYALRAIYSAKYHKKDRAKQDAIIKSFAKSLLKPLKIHFSLNNWQVFDHLPSHKPIILMSNHSTLYDIPILMHTIPGKISFRMLAKKQLHDIPLFGYAMRQFDFPKIDRENHIQALKDLEYTKSLMRSGIVMWAAPEGKRSVDGELLPFKKGVFIMAIELGALIVPISIKDAHKVLPAYTYKYALNETVSLTVGECIDTANYSLAARDFIMGKIRAEIERGMV